MISLSKEPALLVYKGAEVIAYLHYHSWGTPRDFKVACGLYHTKSILKTLDFLEEKGYIEIRPKDDDSNDPKYQLTQKGRKLEHA